MKVVEYGLLDYLSKVKVLGDRTAYEIERIINKPNFSSGRTSYPYMNIESCKGKIIRQQIIQTTYYDTDPNDYSTMPTTIYTYNNEDYRVVNGTQRISSAKARFLKESILFDIYLRHTKLKYDKELVKKYIEYNDYLLNSIGEGKWIDKGLSSILDVKTYEEFARRLMVDKKYGAK